MLVIMTDNDWTEWASLKKLDFTRITTTSGVYEIGASINGQPQPINRANDVDKNGLLYIGKAGNLRKRIKDFWIHIITEGNQHTAAETYLLYGFDTKFHKESLQVRWLALPKGMQEDFEIKLIDARAHATL
jgi:hypothetical protein